MLGQCLVNVFDVDQTLNQHWSKKSVYLMCGSGACTMMGLMGIIVIISSNDTGHFCNNTPPPLALFIQVTLEEVCVTDSLAVRCKRWSLGHANTLW